DHRDSQRRRILKAGTISFGGGAITCTIRNLSATGAALEVTSPVGIPDTFTLVIEMEHLKRDCRVVWRKEKRLGIRFE
ncbi:PilZ domain-containing protein, partial [Serratia marcescens]|uniref:PilZ domain-containing protein n=1 Tax=Serratia marcescens TaxID=615 RepID=UPI002814407F